MAEDRFENVIVGAGLVGSLLARLLVQRGLDVTVFESRPDRRVTDLDAGRSINLVATARGFTGLDRAGLAASVRELSVPVPGRMMHSHTGELTYQPYGRDASESNYSVPRGGLNAFLMTAAEQAGAPFHFQHRLSGVDLDSGTLTFVQEPLGPERRVRARRIFGADGAVSELRAALVAQGRCTSSLEDLGHGYKELRIPPDVGGEFRLEQHALHIWPRGGFMLMALPNLDGSFTVTLYLPNDGNPSFASLDSAEQVMALFESEFADAVPLIPGLPQEFFDNPTGRLGTVRCDPWHLEDRVLLIGDAAHAIVPFFGQGMNCGFEDCRVLDDLVEAHGGDWPRIFSEFSRLRKPAGDAIADMALENFVEMRDHVGDPAFLLRKEVEHRLELAMPREYRSRYSMVVYSDIPYHVAREAGALQDGILDEICRRLDSPDDLDLDAARALIRARLTPLLAERGVSLDY